MDLTPAGDAMQIEEIRRAVKKLEDARKVNRDRAERFGTAYQEPDPTQILTPRELKRLREQTRTGFVTGMDLSTEEEVEKRRRRAARFGEAAPSEVVARMTGEDRDTILTDFGRITQAELDGRSLEDHESERQRKARSKRFGLPDASAKEAAEAAAAALLRRPGDAAGRKQRQRDVGAAEVGTQPKQERDGEDEDEDEEFVRSGRAMLGSGPIRRDALHVAAGAYLRASTSDLMAYFRDYGPSWIEWLNGESVNVIFEDTGSALRAFSALGRPVPRVEAVDPLPEAWREAIRPLRKQRSDKYAAAGAETRIWLRLATEGDVKERAVRTAGARTHGQRGRRGGRNRGGSVVGKPAKQADDGDAARADAASDPAVAGAARAGIVTAAKRKRGRGFQAADSVEEKERADDEPDAKRPKSGAEGEVPGE